MGIASWWKSGQRLRVCSTRPHAGAGAKRVETVTTRQPALQDLLLEIIHTHSPPLLIDLSEVSDMDRSGPMALLVPLRRARLGSGAVELTAASDSVRRIITLADVQDVLSVPAVRPLPSQRQLEEYHGSADSSVLN